MMKAVQVGVELHAAADHGLALLALAAERRVRRTSLRDRGVMGGLVVAGNGIARLGGG